MMMPDGGAANATRAQSLTWRDAYRKIYGELLALYPSDKPYVKSFFKRGPKQKKEAFPAPAGVGK